MRTIYFDYNATTPLDPAVREAMLPFLGEQFGNPSSVHRLGRQARAAVDAAREQVAATWHCKPSEVVFTSGGTESNNLALFGVARSRRDSGRHLITSAIEHPAVLHCCEYLARKEGFRVTYLPVDRTGKVNPEAVREAITAETILVSVMAANNEIGTIQAVSEIGAICRDKGVLFHTDAVQWFGKEPFGTIHQFQADLVSACAHKYHGPKGAGALFIRSPLQLDSLLFGGAHENERRAGTENLASIAGFAAATQRFVSEPVFNPSHLLPLRERLVETVLALRPRGVTFYGSRQRGLANTVSFTVQDADSVTLLAALDLEGICASSGSACAAGSLEPSHVITAVGGGEREAASLVRFSLGRESTMAEVATVESVLPRLISQVAGRE